MTFSSVKCEQEQISIATIINLSIKDDFYSKIPTKNYFFLSHFVV